MAKFQHLHIELEDATRGEIGPQAFEPRGTRALFALALQDLL